MDTHCSAHRGIAQHLLRYHVVIVLRFLGLIVVVLWSWSATHSLPTEVGTGVQWVLTGSHPCDDPPRQEVGHQSASSCLRVCLCDGCCCRD